MLKILSLFLITLLFGCVVVNNPEPNRGLVLIEKNGSGSKLPIDHLVSLSGEELSLASLRGKVLLIHFWATWCAPCVHELRSLQKLEAQLGTDKFRVISIVINDDYREALPLLKRNEILLETFRDPFSAAQQAFGVREVPQSFFVDPQGRLISVYDPSTGQAQYRIVGARDWSSAENVRQITAFLP